MNAQDEGFAVEREQMWSDSRELNARRAVIEQAKGMPMFVFGLDADTAFGALRSQSREHNVKVHLLAEQLVKDLVELTRTSGPSRRPGFDGIMVAARNRITKVAARQLNGDSKTGVPPKNL